MNMYIFGHTCKRFSKQYAQARRVWEHGCTQSSSSAMAVPFKAATNPQCSRGL